MSSSSSSPGSACCSNCGQSCGEQCSESCSNSCRDSCQKNCDCNKLCSDCCSKACTQFCEQTCGTTSTTFVMPASPLLATVFIGAFTDFNPHGPIFITLIGSILLALGLTGFRGYYRNFNFTEINDYTYSLFKNRILFIHSHHDPDDILRGKEFRLRGKYYCTGCYGILAGTIIAILIFVVYLIWYPLFSFTTDSLLFLPILFVPIIVRYSFIKKMSSFPRFLSNMLVPITCSLMLIAIDNIYSNWVLNALVVIFIIFLAFLRSYVSRKT